MQNDANPDNIDRIIDDEVLRVKLRRLIDSAPRQSRVEKILSMPVVSVLIGALITGVLTQCHETRRAQLEMRMLAERESRQQRAALLLARAARRTQTAQKITHLIDLRLWRARRLAGALSTKSNDVNALRKEYQDAVSAWNENLTANLAALEADFGPEIRSEFEESIAERFRRVSSEMEPPRARRAWTELDQLTVAAFHFSVRLNKLAEADVNTTDVLHELR